MYNSSASNNSYTTYNYPNQTLTKTTFIEPNQDIAKMNYGGLTDVTTAKNVAKRLFEMYDRDRDGNINNMEVVPMMVDAYQHMNRRFQPNRQDIDGFYRVCDRNKDGRINYEDVESICMKYLTTAYMKEESSYK